MFYRIELSFTAKANRPDGNHRAGLLWRWAALLIAPPSRFIYFPTFE
jgi:hypothetical protein